MKRIIFLLSLSILIVFNACKKKDDAPEPSALPCANPVFDETGSSGLSLRLAKYEISVKDESMSASGWTFAHVLDAVEGSELKLEVKIEAPDGYLRIETTKIEGKRITPITHSVSEKNPDHIEIPFKMGASETEIKIVLIDKNCNAVTASQKIRPYYKSKVYKGNKIYSQLAAAPKSHFYSLYKNAPYVDGGTLTKSDIELAYIVDEKDNHKPYFISPREEDSAGIMYSAIYESSSIALENLTEADIFAKIDIQWISKSKIEIEAGKTYFIHAGRSKGAIKVNSISGINNEQVNFDYVLLQRTK